MKSHWKIASILTLVLILCLSASAALAADVTGTATGGVNKITVSGTAEPNAALTGSISPKTVGDKTATADANGNYSMTFNSVASGSYTVNVSYSDGTSGAAFNQAGVAVTDPNVAITYAEAAGTSIYINGSAKDSASVKATLNTGASQTATVSDGNFAFSFDGLAPGTYSVTVEYNDGTAGLSDSRSNLVIAAPAPLPTPITISNVTGGVNTITVTGTAEVNQTVSASAGGVNNSVTSDGSGNYSITLSNVPAGNHTVSVTCQSQSATSGTVTVTDPAPAPTAPTIASVTGGVNTITVTGTAAANQTVSANAGSSASNSATSDGSGNYSITINYVPAGSHTVSVTCQGQTATWATPVTVTDPAPATAPIVIGSVVSPQANTLTVTGTAKPNAALSLAAAGQTKAGNADGSGNFSITLSNVTAGTYNSFTVSYTDGTAGTNGTWTNTVTVNNPPDTRKAITLAITKLNDTTLQVTVNSEPGHEVAVSLDGGAALKNSTGSFNASFTVAVPTATKTFTASASYTAGTPATVIATYDYVITGAPAVIDMQLTADATSITVTGTADKTKKVKLALSGPVTAQSPELIPNATTGAFSYTFTGLTVGNYTVVAAYTDNTGVAITKQVTVSTTAKPPLTVDPITTATWTIRGVTSPGLKVTVRTIYGNTSFESSATADSRGVFSIALLRTQEAGKEITIDITYNTNQVATYKFTVVAGSAPVYANLRKGSTGTAVYNLQVALKNLGYTVTVNSVFDNTTEAAVRAFQRINGLGVDGIAGNATQTALYSVTAKPYDTGSSTYPYLVRGDRGSAVTTLQQRLKELGYYTIRVDGIFGVGTQTAVRTFQQKNGLSATGIADSATQSVLFSSNAKANGYTPSSYTTLSRGSRGSAVTQLQSRLASLGYYYGLIDGIYGSQTEAAVYNFQVRNSLTRTGVADVNMQTVLFSSSAISNGSGSSGSSSSTGYVYLSYGSQGEAVRRLQTALKNLGYYTGAIDGLYYNGTYNAVASFQRANGLVVDGIAGKKTQNKLYGTNY